MTSLPALDVASSVQRSVQLDVCVKNFSGNRKNTRYVDERWREEEEAERRVVEVKEDGGVKRGEAKQLLQDVASSLRLRASVCVYTDCWPLSCPSTCGSIWSTLSRWSPPPNPPTLSPTPLRHVS